MKAFITGAANGIGKHTAERLLQQGHDVTAFDIDTDGLARLPDPVNTYKGDVTNEERVAEVVAMEKFDVLVNNAGYQAMGAVEDMEMEEVRRHYETNLFGMWNMTREALPMLRERQGRVVNISSLAGNVAAPFWAAYASTKHAVEGFSDALRREMAPFDVDVVIVEPGPIDTGFNRQGREHLETYLPDSIYSDQYRQLLDHHLDGVDPGVAGRVVAKAATTKRPRARYTVTWQAWLGPKLSCIFPTQVTDWIVMRSV